MRPHSHRLASSLAIGALAIGTLARSATAAGSPASADQPSLAWRPSGVVTASHEAPPNPAPLSRAAKAPTTLAVRPPQQATAMPSPDGAARVAQAAAVGVAHRHAGQVDPSLTPVCHQCGGGPGACSCGMSPAVGPEFADPIESPAMCGDAVGCGDAVCGLGGDCACGDVGCAGECGAVCGCGDVCECGLRPGSLGGCAERGAVPLVLYVPPIQELTFFGGVQGFKSALDNGLDRGAFGFNEGVNVGGRMAWLPAPNLGYQLGYRATQSRLGGDTATQSSDSPSQQFFTGGLFSRKPVGLQYGVVYDHLQDDRRGTLNFGQVRGMISILNPRGHEVGFTFTSRVHEDSIGGVDYRSINQYLLFYRRSGPQGGSFRFYGGLDDQGRGILGSDFEVPLTRSWGLVSGFTFLIPDDSTRGVGSTEEAWNIGTALVWHYGGRAKSCFRSQYRPMFQVADNGSMIIDDAD